MINRSSFVFPVGATLFGLLISGTAFAFSCTNCGNDLHCDSPSPSGATYWSWGPPSSDIVSFLSGQGEEIAIWRCNGTESGGVNGQVTAWTKGPGQGGTKISDYTWVGVCTGLN